MTSEHRELRCRGCSAPIVRGRGDCYLVKILTVADPAPPVISEEDLASDVHSEIQTLLNQIQGLSEQALMDQIYRRELFYLCGSCYHPWIKNPLGG